MAVVAISRQYGAGAHLVGERVVARLGYRLVDREILDHIARQAGVSSHWVEEVEKGAGDWLNRAIAEWLATNVRTRYLHDPSNDFDEVKYRRFLERTIRQIAEEGRVVLLGRGGQLILRDDPRVVRVHLVAREEDRIHRLMEYLGYSQERAEQVARREEKKRLNFLRGFGLGDPDDPLLYHQTINLSLVDLACATDFVCRLAECADARPPAAA